MWSFSLLFLAAFIWSINKVNLTPQGVIDIFRGWPETQDLLARMWPPFIPSEDLNVVAKAVWDTFLMAFAGTFLGLILLCHSYALTHFSHGFLSIANL